MATEGWHLDKRVPISLIATLLVQTIALVWFVAALHKNVEQNTASIKAVQSELALRRPIIENNQVGLAVISSQIDSLTKSTDRLSDKVDDLVITLEKQK